MQKAASNNETNLVDEWNGMKKKKKVFISLLMILERYNSSSLFCFFTFFLIRWTQQFLSSMTCCQHAPLPIYFSVFLLFFFSRSKYGNVQQQNIIIYTFVFYKINFNFPPNNESISLKATEKKLIFFRLLSLLLFLLLIHFIKPSKI